MKQRTIESAAAVRPRALGALAKALLLALVLGGAPVGAAWAVEAGEPAPEFSAPSLRGDGDVSLEDHRGKIVYLDFWASWCGPCLQSIPEIEAMRRKYPADRFQVVAVNVDRDPVKAQRFLRKVRIGYPSASDPFGELPSMFGVETMPTSFVIDENGVIRLVHHGFRSGDMAKLESTIGQLVAGLGDRRTVPAAPAPGAPRGAGR